MKIQSNIPIPDNLKWKGDEVMICVNHKENPVLSEEDEGKRFEADFTIIAEQSASAAIEAFTRQSNDKELDDAVIYNFEVEGQKAIDVKREYAQKAQTSIFKPLPGSGFLNKGTIYSYQNGAVMVVQDHERTIYTPEQTPALFSFYRETTEGQEWIAQEVIKLNDTRTFNGNTYKCIQAHTSLEGWEPDKTPALWSEVISEPVETIEPWHPFDGNNSSLYQTGDKCTFEGFIWESKIDNNSWSPSAYPAGWTKLGEAV